jgi:uncharacterized protein YlaI
MKTCTKCGESKPLSEFYKKQSWCKQCQRQLSVSITRQKYTGCSVEEYNDLFEKQLGCCAICKKHVSTLERSLAADHCHNKKNIRGLLCMNCNSGLGKFEDSVETLKSAIEYLERN